MTSKQNIIQVNNLTKYYGETVGVDAISFEVKQGEIFGFLGPNGSGKTTTIRLLLDLLKKDRGEITIFGKELTSHSKQIRERCGYLPGEFQAYKHLTGRQYLEMFSLHKKAKENDFEHLVKIFDLKNKDLNRKISQYSRGMMQKLGIIQAFMRHPELIILDEPTSGLDPLMQEAFYRLIFKKQKEGSTIFFSSHNLPEVEKLCTRLAIIRHGKIISIESIESLKEKLGLILDLVLNETSTAPEISGTELISAENNHFIFKIKGKPGPILEKISRLPVKDITISRPSLENIFMEYYKTN